MAIPRRGTFLPKITEMDGFVKISVAWTRLARIISAPSYKESERKTSSVSPLCSLLLEVGWWRGNRISLAVHKRSRRPRVISVRGNGHGINFNNKQLESLRK